MEYTMLRNSDLKVSRLCMGGCPMGGYGWGDTQENELIEAVHTAVDQGVNFFDTADTYGLGQSEKTLGKALGSHRKDVVIASKFGVRIENGKTFYDNSSSWIKKAVEGSLRRLGTDYIDLYQIHYRDGKTPIGEVIETLEEMKKKGYIRYYGLSNIHEDDIEEIKPFRGKFVSFQDEYSLACRKNESDMKSIAQDLEMTILTWGSLGQGILTGKYTKLFEARHAIYSCQDIFQVKEIYLTQVASHYHFWGLMVKKGFLPKWVFQGEPGESALQLYSLLKPYIDKRRDEKKSYAENYIWLISQIEQMK